MNHSFQNMWKNTIISRTKDNKFLVFSGLTNKHMFWDYDPEYSVVYVRDEAFNFLKDRLQSIKHLAFDDDSQAYTQPVDISCIWRSE